MNLAFYLSLISLSVSLPLPDLHSSAPSGSSGSFSLPLTRRNITSNHLLSPSELHLRLQSNAASVSQKYNVDELSKRDSSPGFVQLGDSQGDNDYFATVYIGTPPVAFELTVDTGSADLIVQTAPCLSGCDSTTPLYRPGDSSTSSTNKSTFSINYQVGSATGSIISDVVGFGGYSQVQQFGAVTTSASAIGPGGVNGVLGMAFEPLSSMQQTPFLQALAQARKLTQPVFVFGFALATQGIDAEVITPGGTLNIGEVNPSLFTGSINYSPVNSPFYWQIALDSISLGNKKVVVNTRYATIDTGTTNIYVPAAIADAFYSQIPGASSIGSGLYVYPCNSVLNAALVFNKISYSIPDVNFNIGSYNNGRCYGAIASLGPSPDTYIIGATFLKNFYVAFRFSDPPSVGFATLANPAALKIGTAPIGNALTIAQGGNAPSNPSIISSAVVSAPVVPIAQPQEAAGLVVISAKVPSPPAPVSFPTAVSAPGSIASFASAIQNGITTLINEIAQNIHNTGLLLTCKGTINRTNALWNCSTN